MTDQPDWKKITEGFDRPFGRDEVRQRNAFEGGKMLSYITARAVMFRLDAVVGRENWSDAYEVIDPQRLGILCRLTVHGITKCGVGYPNNPPGTKGDRGKGGKDSESDALKRAAVKFGIGRHLYGEHYEYEDEEEALGGADQAEPVSSEPRTKQGSIKPQVLGTAADERKTILTTLEGVMSELSTMRGNDEDWRVVVRQGAAQLGITGKTLGDISNEGLVRIGTWGRSQIELLSTAAPQEPPPAAPEGQNAYSF